MGRVSRENVGVLAGFAGVALLVFAIFVPGNLALVPALLSVPLFGVAANRGAFTSRRGNVGD